VCAEVQSAEDVMETVPLIYVDGTTVSAVTTDTIGLQKVLKENNVYSNIHTITDTVREVVSITENLIMYEP
jgi:hypothetical protein